MSCYWKTFCDSRRNDPAHVSRLLASNIVSASIACLLSSLSLVRSDSIRLLEPLNARFDFDVRSNRRDYRFPHFPQKRPKRARVLRYRHTSSLESSYTEITPNRIADRMSRATEASLSGRRLERSRNAVRMRAGDIRLPLPPPPSPSAADFSASPSSLTCVLLCATATTVHTLFHGLPVDAVYLGSGTFDPWLRSENFTPNQHHWKLSLFFVKFRVVLFRALLLPFQFLFHHVEASSPLGHVLHDQRGDGIYTKAISSMSIISYLSIRSRLCQRASISSRIKDRWIVLAYPRTNGTLRWLTKSELDPTLPRRYTRLHLHVSSHAFSFIWPHVAMVIDTRVSVTVPNRFV